MKIETALLVIGGTILAVSAVNFAVTNVPQLYQSASVTSFNALLQKLNPLFYMGVVIPPNIPTPGDGNAS